MSGILNNTSREDISVNNDINYPVNNQLNEAVLKECCWNKINFIHFIFCIYWVFHFFIWRMLTYVLLLKHQQKTNKTNSNSNKLL